MERTIHRLFTTVTPEMFTRAESRDVHQVALTAYSIAISALPRRMSSSRDVRPKTVPNARAMYASPPEKESIVSMSTPMVHRSAVGSHVSTARRDRQKDVFVQCVALPNLLCKRTVLYTTFSFEMLVERSLVGLFYRIVYFSSLFLPL